MARRGVRMPNTFTAWATFILMVALAVAVIFRVPQIRGFVTGA